jgi:hypothetical protein
VLTRKGLDLCVERVPQWDPDAGSIDLCHWYAGTLALGERRGSAATRWRKWDDALRAWGAEGGRVYATAMLASALLLTRS